MQRRTKHWYVTGKSSYLGIEGLNMGDIGYVNYQSYKRIFQLTETSYLGIDRLTY